MGDNKNIQAMYEARRRCPKECVDCSNLSVIAEHDECCGYHSILPICTAYDEPDMSCEDQLSNGSCPCHPMEEDHE